MDPLGILEEARERSRETLALAARHLDPSLVEVLRIIGFDEEYVSARGSYLYDSAGRAYLDLHTGEGFASLGHNHPDVRAVLQAALGEDLLDGVQIHYSALAGMLAQELSARLPQGLDALFFASTGAEAVDAAMKFARAATGRARFVSCESSFHGVTIGPLSIVGDEFFKEGFGPLLPGCELVPFGDLERLEAQLRRGDVAAFVVEPIQGRTVAPAPAGYLRAAQELCRRHGTMFVLDEIQTGLGRTGRWFALEEWGLEPDFVLVGKALSGGCMPVAAMATTMDIHQRAVGTLERSYVHQSTYGRNRLSMAAGLATMRIIERDGLVEHAAEVGGLLRAGLAELQGRHEIVTEIRGRGLMIGIELGAPRGSVARVSWRLVRAAAEGLYPQLIVIPLHRDHGVITMAAGKNDVIKLLPPMTLSAAEAQSFLDALAVVLGDCEGSTSKNWAVVRDIAKATLMRGGREPSGDAGRMRPGRDGVAPSASATPTPTPAPAPGDTAASPASDTSAPARSAARTLDGGAVLVTGATGFIGGHLARRLAAEGRPVRCLVREHSDTSSLEELDVELAVGDLTSGRSLSGAVEGCEFVFHCGALVSDWATTQEITRTNVTGTRNLLEASAGASVRRFVHFSTTDVYGHPGTAAVEETYASRRFSNWYAQTKLKAEREVRAAEAAAGFDAVILRPATVYGPGSSEVVGGIARAIRDRNMLLIDGGRSDAGLCFVANLLDAALLALEHDAAPGLAFNVSDGLGVTWREFTDGLAAGLGCSRVRWSVPYWAANGVGTSLEHGYRLLRRTTGMTVRPLLSRQAVQVLGRDQSFSNAKARELLGWEPRVDYASGLEATLTWLKSEYLD